MRYDPLDLAGGDGALPAPGARFRSPAPRHAGAGAPLRAARRVRASAEDGLRLAVHVHASTMQACTAWLTPALASPWLFATAGRPVACLHLDARVGGRFHFQDRGAAGRTDYRGRYVALEPGRRLAFTLDLHQATTHVEVTFLPRPRGCRVALLHRAVPARQRDACAARWRGILHGLRLALDA